MASTRIPTAKTAMTTASILNGYSTDAEAEPPKVQLQTEFLKTGAS